MQEMELDWLQALCPCKTNGPKLNAGPGIRSACHFHSRGGDQSEESK